MNETPDAIDRVGSMERVREDAAKRGLPIQILTMDRSTHTAEDAARACGCDTSQIVKSLIFENAGDGTLVLMLVSGAYTINTDYVAKAYGIRLGKCDARRVREETGFAVGGVAPLGHISEMVVHMDSRLLAYPVVWCAAGRPGSVFSVNPEKLRDAIGANVIDMAGRTRGTF